MIYYNASIKVDKTSPTFEQLQLLKHKALKIVLVTETWPPEVNGVALSVFHFAKALQKRGHHIFLVRPEQKSSSEFVAKAECLVKAHRIPKYEQLKFGRPQFFKVAKFIKNVNPDVVHIVTEGPLGLAALSFARKNKIAVSSGFHSPFHEFSRFFDLGFLVKPVQHYLKWFHNQTQLTCVPSLDTKKNLDKLGVSCPMQVVGRGVDSERFSPTHRSSALRHQMGATDDTTVMLYVGRLSPEKQIEEVIISFELLQQAQPNRDVQLWIVGDGPDRQRLEGNNPKIHFIGMIVGEQLSRYYASADIFAFASQVETYGNVVLEAMASGLAVIAYDYACAAMMVRDQQSGVLIPLGQNQQFQNSIATLAEIKMIRQMGKVARKASLEQGWELPVRQFEHALHTAISTVS